MFEYRIVGSDYFSLAESQFSTRFFDLFHGGAGKTRHTDSLLVATALVG